MPKFIDLEDVLKVIDQMKDDYIENKGPLLLQGYDEERLVYFFVTDIKEQLRKLEEKTIENNIYHECVIGLFNYVEDSELVTLQRLKYLAHNHYALYTMKQYTDWRYDTNLTRFTHCPDCGEKIDWDRIRREVNDETNNK